MLNRNSNRNQSDGLDSSETLAADEAQEKLADKQADVSTKAAEEATRVEKEEMERRAENQRLEKERTDRERQRREVLQPWKDMQQSLAHAESDELITLPLVAGETDLLSQLYTLMDRLFDTRNPDLLARLPSIVDDFICLLAPLIEASNVVASHRSRDASKMASEFSKGGNATLAALLVCCDATKKETNEEDGVATKLERVKKAICSYYEIESESVLPKKVEAFVRLGRPTRNMLMHLFHLIIGYFIISELTLSDVVASLPKDLADYIIEKAEELASLVNPNASFSSSMTILSYLNTFALPGFEMDNAWELSAEVVMGIIDSLTNVGNTPANLESHRTLVVEPHFKPKQHYTVSGGMNESEVDYCGGTDSVHTKRRRRITRVLLLLALKRPITRRLPNDFFDECGGFTRCLLRLGQ